MTLHNGPDVPGPLATTGGAIATLVAFALAWLLLFLVLLALAHRHTVHTVRREQAREDA